MASAQEAGTYKIYIESPSGERRQVVSGSSAALGPGGSPDGAIANTPEKWVYIPPSSVIGGSGYKVVFTVTPGAADTLDASDMAWSIPLLVNGMAETIGNDQGPGGLGNSNFVVDQAGSNQVLVADQERTYAVYRAKEGVSFQVGGGNIFYTYEDDTA